MPFVICDMATAQVKPSAGSKILGCKMTDGVAGVAPCRVQARKLAALGINDSRTSESEVEIEPLHKARTSVMGGRSAHAASGSDNPSNYGLENSISKV